MSMASSQLWESLGHGALMSCLQTPLGGPTEVMALV